MIPYDFSKKDYVNDVREMIYSGSGCKDFGFDDNGRRFLSRRALNEGYDQYQRALMEQDEAFESAESRLAEAFKAFQYLETVHYRCGDECLSDEGVIQP